MIKADISGAGNYLDRAVWSAKLRDACEALRNEKDYAGWLHLPSETPGDAVEKICRAAESVRSRCEVLLVIGIGGSYLGAKAAIELLRPKYRADSPEVIFAGNTLSGTETQELLDYLETKDFMINVVSKSGTTTEPALALRVFYALLQRKYGEVAPSRVIATTDETGGALRRLASELGFESFVIPRNIGGRYSVLTPVGLLPIAAAGGDIRAMLGGAREAETEYMATGAENAAGEYAAARSALYASGRKIEVLAYWEPRLRWLGEWWKQLFGESEGKGGQGLFPASVEYSADLHSLGQYMQQGERIMFETVLSCSDGAALTVPALPSWGDGFDAVAGKRLDYVASAAREGSIRAHTEGGVPCLRLEIGALDAQTLGGLFYFFEYSCALSAYALGVYPFDQPGVEAYKKYMLGALGIK